MSRNIWTLNSTSGLSLVSFELSELVGETAWGDFVFTCSSVEQPEETLWQMRLRNQGVQRSAFQTLSTGLAGWLSNGTPFSTPLVDAEVRLQMDVRVRDTELILGTGKAAVRFFVDGVGLSSCTVAFVVDQSCARLAVESLARMNLGLELSKMN